MSANVIIIIYYKHFFTDFLIKPALLLHIIWINHFINKNHLHLSTFMYFCNLETKT